MGEYSDRVKADIVSDNAARKILYLIFAVIAVIAVFLLGGFAFFVAVLGLGPVLVLIVVVEIYCRIQNWRRLRAAEEADADLDKFRPRTEILPGDVIHKLRARAHQAQKAGEPHLARDLRLASATLERLRPRSATSGPLRRSARSRLTKGNWRREILIARGFLWLFFGAC